MDEFDLAEADFERATELGPRRRGALRHAGQPRRDAGPPGAARRPRPRTSWPRSRLKPDQFQAYVNLAQAYQNLDRLDDALERPRPGDRPGPGQAVLYRARAQIHRLRSHDAEALDDLDRAIALAPPDDPALAGDHLERALIFQQAGRNAEALAECDRALAIQPGRPDVHRIRGAVLVKLKRFDEAIRSFDICLANGDALRRRSTRPGAWHWRTAAPTSRAIADYTLAMGTGRGDRIVVHAIGAGPTCSAGPPRPPRTTSTRRCDSIPADARALSGRALANVQQRKVPEAVADARASAAANPARMPRLLYNAARVYCQAAAHPRGRPRPVPRRAGTPPAATGSRP